MGAAQMEVEVCRGKEHRKARARPSSVCMCAHSCDSVTTARPLDLRDCCCQSLSPPFYCETSQVFPGVRACARARVRIGLLVSHSVLLCVWPVGSLRTPIWSPERTRSRCARLSGSERRNVASVASTHIWVQHAGTISNVHLVKNPEREYMKIFAFITTMSLTGILAVVKNMCLKRFVTL